MSFATDKIEKVQEQLGEEGLSGWLFYDFRRSNPLAYTFLEIAPHTMLTRRFFYWIPQKGDPIKVVSLIEPHVLDHLPGIKWTYRSWQELEQLLFSLLPKNKKIAMEYSSILPAVSKVDGGTIDLIRRYGLEVVSSAHLLQPYTSVWSKEQLESHRQAAQVLEEVVNLTWAFIFRALSQREPINEYDVQQWMLKEMAQRGCVTADPPICAINGHSADPHYAPQRETASIIQEEDFILLDLWCKQNRPQAVYADITRVGVAANRPSARQQEIFAIVKRARDQATQFVQEQYAQGKLVEGWQVDQVCRDSITEAGYGPFFIHRTGHNIGEEDHGPGANLDNFETHDFRRLLPGTCFSIEPGIYLPGEFGVRLEYDVYLPIDSNRILITGGIQTAITCLESLL